MTTVEHYFENLLLNDRDCGRNFDDNKKQLTEEELRTVHQCYNYILFNLFHGSKEDLHSWVKEK